MRPLERDVLICMLAACAGSADGWSFFGLGHAFVANMTGNTVLLGMSVFRVHGDFVHPLIALACYAIGVITGSLLTRNVKPEVDGSPWPRRISFTLLFEALLLLAAQVRWFALYPTGPAQETHTLLLGCVAVAIGLQSAAMLQLKIPGIVTTYISGTWTTLMSGLARIHSESPVERQKFESRLGMQAPLS